MKQVGCKIEEYRANVSIPKSLVNHVNKRKNLDKVEGMTLEDDERSNMQKHKIVQSSCLICKSCMNRQKIEALFTISRGTFLEILVTV